VIASMSLPGIFPPVEIAGRLHIDGGIANNVPLDKAEELGARVAYLIECACAKRSTAARLERPCGAQLLDRGRRQIHC